MEEDITKLIKSVKTLYIKEKSLGFDLMNELGKKEYSVYESKQKALDDSKIGDIIHEVNIKNSFGVTAKLTKLTK